MGVYSENLPTAMAEQLRSEKGAAELTYQEIADALDIHQQSVIRYFKGTRDIPMSVVIRLAELFGLTPAELMERATERIK